MIDVGLVGLALASISLILSLRLIFIFRKYGRVVNRAMSITGKMGKQKQVNQAKLERAEVAIKEGGMEMLFQKFPELQLLVGYMKEKYPESYDDLLDNPRLILALYNKYAPFLGQVLGLVKGGQREKERYDL